MRRVILRALNQETAEIMKAKLLKIGAIRETLLHDKHGGLHWLRRRGWLSMRRVVVDPRLSEYFCLRIEELTISVACRLTGLVLQQVAALGDKLRNLAADLSRMAEEFGRTGAGSDTSPDLPSPRSQMIEGLVAEHLATHKAALVAAMMRTLDPDFCRLDAAENNGSPLRLRPRLRSTARSLILADLRQLALGQIEAGPVGPYQPLFSIEGGLAAAVARLNRCGGRRRLLLTVPSSLQAEPILKRLTDGKAAQRPTVVADAENEIVLCYETEQLPLRRVVACVLDHRFQYVEVASRVHTRVDVDWLPL